VCDRLVNGHIIAIDRSATMIRAATTRNREHVGSGTARLHVSALVEAGFGPQRDDISPQEAGCSCSPSR